VLVYVTLLAGVGLADLFLLSQRQDMSMAGAMRAHDTGQAVAWLLTCRLLPLATACASALVLLRLLRSARRQHAQTQAVLRPLLAHPALAAPAQLVPLLQALQLDQCTMLIVCECPVALCYGLLRPRLLVRAFTEALPLPALKAMAQAVPLAQELAADRDVLAAVGPVALSGALLKVGDALDALQVPPSEPHTQDWWLAVGAFSAIDARIDQILGAPIPSQLGMADMALPLLVLGLLASGPLLCFLLPFPMAVVWAGGVLAVARWQRLRLLIDLLIRRGR
jgi:hypothetical protein